MRLLFIFHLFIYYIQARTLWWFSDMELDIV